MIEIKDEDCFAHDIGLLIKCDDWEQLKQQILQDHEDAKNWRELEIDCQAEIAQILFLDDIRKNEKDRQIVKRLEEYINHHDWVQSELKYKSNESLKKFHEQIKKILDGKK